MSEITAPPFCARPVWSRPMTCLPSSRAALASVATTVTEPVPPMPMTWMLKPKLSSILLTGVGKLALERRNAALLLFLAIARPAAGFGVMVRNEGQKPLTQEKSLLHEDWWMRVLRPNSVCTGSTLMQLRLDAAVAAAFADALVDDRDFGGFLGLAAAARTAQFGRAFLVVHQHGGAGRLRPARAGLRPGGRGARLRVPPAGR